MLNLDIKFSVKVGFEDIVVNACNVVELVDMPTKPNLVIDFKGGLDSISLKEN